MRVFVVSPILVLLKVDQMDDDVVDGFSPASTHCIYFSDLEQIRKTISLFTFADTAQNGLNKGQQIFSFSRQCPSSGRPSLPAMLYFSVI